MVCYDLDELFSNIFGPPKRCDNPTHTLVSTFSTFWPLGLVAFGGPQAHVAILRDHLVEQRQWMDEEEFTELFAIGQGIIRLWCFFFSL